MPFAARKLKWILTLCVVYSPSVAVCGEVLFERDIRPILKAHCFHCHGEDGTKEGELDVRLRHFLVSGGESGPALVPGKPAESLLLARITAGEMPPEDVEQRLTSDELARLEAWIAQGARTAREEPASLEAGTYFTEEERRHWSFQRIQRPALPETAGGSEAVQSSVDPFVLSRLSEHGLDRAPQAAPATRLRRAFLDLIGVPPTVEETRRFVADTTPDAYEKLLDRLLASPAYGERWGRHWLDVAGYADSEGYTDADSERPYAYRYRDYVIRAFNADLPLDQFVTEQLAGDELIGRALKNLTDDEVRLLEATGFLRTAPDGTAAGDVDQPLARNEVVAKTIEIASSSLLGLTVSCAQCHHHRYDPIPQQDYYRLRAVFEPALNWQQWLSPPKRRFSLYTDADKAAAEKIEQEAKALDAARARKQEEFIAATFEKELAKLDATLRPAIRAARETTEKERTAEQKQLLAKYPSVNVTSSSLYLYDGKAAGVLKKMTEDATKLRATKPQQEYLRALFEPSGTPPKTFLFHRGDHQQPKQEVQPAALSVLSEAIDSQLSVESPQTVSSGRRLAFARWVTDRNNPLFARVQVNRIWLHHFGQGIVRTPADFGTLGTPPTHPKLLDWLATEFMESGFGAKHLHRLIMTSATYQRDSQATALQLQKDREQRWLGSMPIRRIDAETLRDAVLALSDDLNYRRGGPAVPVMADRVGQFVIGKENLNAGRPGPVIAMQGEEYRRSIYVQVRRSRPLSVMEPFDLPRMEPNCKVRAASTSATQALLMMNGDFVLKQADRLARRLANEASEQPQQVALLWMILYAREVTADEQQAALAFLKGQTATFLESLPKPKEGTAEAQAQHEAWVSLCHALFSSNEFLYIE